MAHQTHHPSTSSNSRLGFFLFFYDETVNNDIKNKTANVVSEVSCAVQKQDEHAVYHAVCVNGLLLAKGSRNVT